MNVLVVCHRLPFPPTRGGKIRPFNIIRHFSEAGHRVTVASLARSASEARDGQGLQDYCEELLVGTIPRGRAAMQMVGCLATSSPSSMGYFHSGALRRRLNDLLKRRRFDLIFVHCSSVAGYVANVDGVPKILDFGDMDSQKWLLYARHRRPPLSFGYWLEGTKLQRAEVQLARRFDLCTCTTKAELDTLRGYGTGVPTGWFPNGVDADFFRPSDDPYDPDTISFVGRMDYFPNQQAVLMFCEQVLPAIRARRPRTRMRVVGAAPSRAIRALHGIDGVEVTGTVDDVRPYVHGSAMTVAPLRIARGTQNKILESMAMGVPVVASSMAVRGIDAVAPDHILAADAPEEFADAVVSLLEDPRRREQLSRSGRDRVLSHHSWRTALDRLDGLVADCLGRREAIGG